MGVAPRTLARAAATFSVLLIVFGFVGIVTAQESGDAEQLRLGRAAMAAHDPTTAITHFEKADTIEAREWLAVALMMESRSPSDQYVERAFEAALRARALQPAQVPARAELATAMRPGEFVIAFLIGEVYAYAWAFDRDAFVGYQLPAPAELATGVARARAYIDSGDRAGVLRIAEELMPALLGPARERLPKLKRLIFVLDGTLRDLPVGELPPGEGQSPLQQQLAISLTEPGALLEAIRADPSPPPATAPSWQRRSIVIGGILVAILAIAAIAGWWRR